MVGCHHQLNGHEFEQALGVGDGQGGLACCGSWGCKESDTTEQLNWLTEVKGPFTKMWQRLRKSRWWEQDWESDNCRWVWRAVSPLGSGRWGDGMLGRIWMEQLCGEGYMKGTELFSKGTQTIWCGLLRRQLGERNTPFTLFQYFKNLLLPLSRRWT